jgi:peptide/nickel transport system substrate-binding protein
MRDNAGVWLSRFGMQLAVVDNRTFSIETPSPTPMVLLALSAPSDPPFIMRERDATNPPEKAVAEIVGSGPFRFVASEYVPGSRIVYARNLDYVPRDEPASGFAGGKKVFVDRVEFRIMPDPATAAAALQKGEVDLWEAPPLDLLPLLRKQPHIVTRSLTTGGLMIGMRPNHLFPPFNDARARQALLAMVNQPDYMELASGGDPSNTRACFSFLGCGLPTSSEAGMDGFRKQNFEKARKLLKDAGYDGRPIVLMQPTDLPLMRDAALLAVQVLRQGGLNLDVQPMDWATLVQRRAKQDPPAAGGWDLFITFTPEMQLRSPIANPFMDSPCGGKGWYGWPCDPKLNSLRDAWATEIDQAKSTTIYHAIQEQAAKSVPFVPLGEYFTPLVSRDAITDLLDTPLAVFWNVKKVD